MKSDVMLGADPEMGFLNSAGFIVQAKDVFVDQEDSKHAKFGCDGTDAIAELRPDPSRSPMQVVRNLRHDMVEAITQYGQLKDVQWKAGTICDTFSLGGHIHFGAWEYMTVPRADDPRGDLTMVPRLQGIQKLLHLLLATPCVLLERPEEAIMRRCVAPAPGQRPYGAFDHRVLSLQNHGFEYRPLASWLTSPHVATSVLCLAKAIMDDYVDGKFPNERIELLAQECLYDQGSLTKYRETQLRESYVKIWPHIVGLSRFAEYREYLTFLNTLVTERLTWYPMVSMPEAWGITLTDEGTIPMSESPIVTNLDIFEDFFI